MSKKKLLMTASTFPRWEGDTEPRFILDLAKVVNEYYDVTVLAPAGIGARDSEIMEGVKVIRYHYLPVHKWEMLCYPGAIVPRIKAKKIRALQVPFLFMALWVTLLRLKSKFDLVHVHWLIPQGIVQGLVGGRNVITCHGTDLTSMNSGIVKKLKQLCINKARHVTVVSKKLYQILKEVYNVPDEKISIISMGCSLSSFSPAFRDERLLNADGAKSVLFVGRLVEVKGVKYLIDAMEYVDAKLYIVGTGPDEEMLKKRAEKYSSKVTFLGSKSHQELAALYASADVCVFPSIHASDGTEEGFGLVIIEAMASGTPVVASKSGGIVDIIEDGVNGLFAEEKNSADLAQKINAVLQDPAFEARLRSQAAESVKKYDYSVIARKYADIYDKVLNGGVNK